MTEFEIIRRYFTGRGIRRADVVVGIGDDGAVVQVPSDSDLVTVVDTLVAGVHFPPETHPADIAYKALAVNLSDMAAMGAIPAWATLAVSLPQADEVWLEAFAQGFFQLAERYGVQLIGGDTTRGPLTITVQVQGTVPTGGAVRRAGARPGDLVYVTGNLGDAGLALQAWRQQRPLPHPHGDDLVARLHRPTPRCEEGAALRGLATAMIDISDGLTADLAHLLEASGVGATLDVEAIPLSASFRACAGDEGLTQEQRLSLALTAGDDYELCFTAPAAQRHRVEQVFARFASGCHVVGAIEERPGLRLKQGDGSLLRLSGGYDHFNTVPQGDGA